MDQNALNQFTRNRKKKRGHRIGYEKITYNLMINLILKNYRMLVLCLKSLLKQYSKYSDELEQSLS